MKGSKALPSCAILFDATFAILITAVAVAAWDPVWHGPGLSKTPTTFCVWEFVCTNQCLVTPSSAWCKSSSAKSSEEDEDDSAVSPGPEANKDSDFLRHPTSGRGPPFYFSYSKR